MRCTPDRTVRVQALAGALRCVLEQDTCTSEFKAYNINLSLSKNILIMVMMMMMIQKIVCWPTNIKAKCMENGKDKCHFWRHMVHMVLCFLYFEKFIIICFCWLNYFLLFFILFSDLTSGHVTRGNFSCNLQRNNVALQVAVKLASCNKAFTYFC